MSAGTNPWSAKLQQGRAQMMLGVVRHLRGEHDGETVGTDVPAHDFLAVGEKDRAG